MHGVRRDEVVDISEEGDVFGGSVWVEECEYQDGKKGDCQAHEDQNECKEEASSIFHGGPEEFQEHTEHWVGWHRGGRANE